jgi:hypothetical protein
METYKIYKDSWACYKNFNTQQDAELFASSLGSGYLVVLADPKDKIIPITLEQRLPADIDFGISLINEFLLDNRKIGYISNQDSISLLTKFKDIKEMCSLGAIRDVQVMMGNVVTDTVFTQDRKNKYLEMINSYLNNYV